MKRTILQIGSIVFLCVCLWSCMKISDSFQGLTSEGLDVEKYIGLKYDIGLTDGNGITVGIVDTGIEENECITRSRIIKFIDFVNNNHMPYDDNGHGTNVAGVIGANCALKGISPNSNFVVLKVLDDKGNSDVDTFRKAIEWLVENSQRYNIKIVNISAGIDSSLNSVFEIDTMLKELMRMRVFIIAAAGNNTDNKKTILFPGSSRNVWTIGSIKTNLTYSMDDDIVASFSSGKVLYEDSKKPDFLTLGVDISTVDVDGNIVYRSGTSFSTAIVSGVVAQLLQKNQYDFNKVNSILNNSICGINNNSKQGRGELCLK